VRRRAARTSAAIATALLCLLARAAYAQEAKPGEYEVKAIYLYNFGKFVQYPAGSGAEGFRICVLGRDPFGATLDRTLANETIEGKPLQAKRIDKIEDVGDCRILFISSSEDSQLKRILAALQSKPVLTVSEMPEFCNRGGMVQFVVQEKKVRFEVNPTAAEKAGLMLSSQLLKIATEVRKSP
jgi:hypothetical protein